MASNFKISDDMKNAFTSVDAAMTLLNKFPKLNTTNTDLAFQSGANSMSFLMDLLKHILGEKKTIKLILKIINYCLSPLEITVKAILINNLNKQTTCGLKPMSFDMINDGFSFDMKAIDLFGMLNYNPLDEKKGKYYYFGCTPQDIGKGTVYPDDIVKSKDMNAFIWYIMNRCPHRDVWAGYTIQNKAPIPSVAKVKQWWKDGFVTLEFDGRSSGMTTALGKSMTVQTPVDNCMHVFPGNTKILDDNETASLEKVFQQDNEYIHDYSAFLDSIDIQIANLTSIFNQYPSITIQSDISILNEIKSQINGNKPLYLLDVFSKDTTTGHYCYILQSSKEKIIIPNDDFYTKTIKDYIDNRNGAYQRFQKVLKNRITTEGNYKANETNMFYMLPIQYFNSSYILSLKLFDSTCIFSQLMDSLTGVLSNALSLSFSERLARAEIRRMIEEIVTTDTTVTSDCFFSFDNSQYNQMLESTERQRMQMYDPPYGRSNGGKIDLEELMSDVNNLAQNATPEESQEAMEKSIYKFVSKDVEIENGDSNDGNWSSFLDNLINSLIMSIMMSIMSPKVYIAFGINQKLMGMDTSNDIQSFINSNRNMMVTIIRTIRDEILRYINDELKKELAEIAENVASVLSLEQLNYYKELIAKCVKCYNLLSIGINKNTTDWNLDNVNHADILDNNNEALDAENNQC